MLQRLESFDSIIIASGCNFADALTGSYLASAENAPILLYYGEASIAQNVDYITENLAPEGQVYILGGTARVNDSSVKKIFAITADGTFPSLKFFLTSDSEPPEISGGPFSYAI